MSFDDFLRNKMQYGANNGFAPLFIPDYLFDFQKWLVDWSVRKGRSAIFTDCGTGKTVMELVIGQNIVEKTNRPVLILTPPAVARQTLDEAEKFCIEAHRANPEYQEGKHIQVINYEQLHKFDSRNYGGIICDESSILKNVKGKRKNQIIEFMRIALYRLLATATAAPNDWVELGTSSEALGWLGFQDMLNEFFTHRQSYREGHKEKYYIKGWAEKGPFWQWVASWARAARYPSDLGFDDDGFILPELIENDVEVKANNPTPGMLWDLPARNWNEEREAIRRTLTERCEMVAQRLEERGEQIAVVWCHLNPEGDLLEKIIPGAVQVSGKDSEEKKEEVARWFVHGASERRIIITKPKIFGWGLNWQHCNYMTYFPTHSYEQYYQAVRRLWRFGQTKSVTVDRIYTSGTQRIFDNLRRKTKQADTMFDQLVRFMGKELHLENVYERQRIEVPQWMK